MSAGAGACACSRSPPSRPTRTAPGSGSAAPSGGGEGRSCRSGLGWETGTVHVGALPEAKGPTASQNMRVGFLASELLGPAAWSSATASTPPAMPPDRSQTMSCVNCMHRPHQEQQLKAAAVCDAMVLLVVSDVLCQRRGELPPHGPRRSPVSWPASSSAFIEFIDLSPACLATTANCIEVVSCSLPCGTEPVQAGQARRSGSCAPTTPNPSSTSRERPGQREGAGCADVRTATNCATLDDRPPQLHGQPQPVAAGVSSRDIL